MSLLRYGYPSDGVTRRYRFLYNSYGELARIELPTGGAIEYDWGPGLANGANGGAVNSIPNVAHSTEIDANLPQIYRRLLVRRSYDAGNVLLGSTTYSRPESQNWDNSISNTGYVASTHLGANGQSQGVVRHYFYGSPVTSFFTWQASPQYLPTYSPFATYRDGREYQTEFYAANGTSLLRRETQSWDQPFLSWWSGSQGTAPSNCPFVKETVITLADSGQVSKTTNINPSNGQIMIDQFGNPLDTWIYDYGQGQPGPVIRRMHTEFLAVNPVNGVNYVNRTSASSPHRLNLPTRMSVYDANDIERARTINEYDNYISDSGHAPLVSRSSISGLDPSYNTSYSTRGNTTATTRYLLTNGTPTGSITGYVQYDIAGNTVKTIDARGNPTNFDFSDRFGTPDSDARANSGSTELNVAGQYSYAFNTLTTNALGQTTYTQYDYYIGKAVDGEDANGTTFSGFYSDALDRPTQAIRGANRDTSLKSRMLYTYDDVNRVTTQTSDFNSFAEANPLKTQTLYDGMGRVIETKQYEDASNYIAVRQRYDALGRSSQTSNPFRNGETPVWTTTGFDELSRITSFTTADNSVTSTSFTGNAATVTDPTGKKQKTVTDALGRVVKVYEDPTGVNWLTDYAYDALDNLLSVSQYDPVSQVTQVRTSTYDSLNRLLTATNPENGTVSYIYDEQGNVIVYTDARGVSRHASYDVLNRPTRRWYNSSNSISATVNNSPALPAGVGTSEEINMIYDSQPLPGGSPPGFSRGYATGRLVATTYGGGGSGDYSSFDALGRVVIKVQQTGSVNYQITASYNNGGARKSLGYPSGHVVNYNYDQAGRLGDKDAQNLAMTGNLGDGVTRTYSTAISYSPFGGMKQEQYGTTTPIYNKHFFNVRGQLSEIRLSTYSITTPGQETNWNRGALINRYSWQSWSGSGTDNNSNLKQQMIYIPNDDQISGYMMNAHSYNYDAMNRLDKVEEFADGSTFSWRQDYDYDRWGNRTINATNTTNGLPKPQFSVAPTTNRLGVPSGQSGTIGYDSAGNVTNDTYTGQGQRTYDAQNRMTQAWSNNQWQTYTYDGNGRRVKRNIYNSETWQIYGMGGELLAEYAAGGSVSQLRKEYGYRNGQLLIAAAGQNCGVGYQGTKTWGATNPSLGHNTGQAQGGDWVATAGTHSPGHMFFGPYDSTFGQGHHNAKFLLQVNNNSGSDVLATLDVVTSLGGVVLAQRQVRRNEFTAANQWQWFTLEFDNPCFGLVEARVYWHGNTTLLLNQVTVSGINTAGVMVEWLIGDQLGTPRMIADKTGTLAGISRHDYLPFGEEILAGTGGRTTTQGYNQSDGLRQHFTSYERDDETGLDFAQARYYASVQGRFTGVDPVGGMIANPQSWNGYTYTLNNPVNLTDPTGMFANAEYGSDPGREMDPFLDWGKKRSLWTDEIARALAAYQQMVETGIANLKLKQQQKKQQEEQQKLASDSVTVKAKDQTVVVTVQQMNQPAAFTGKVINGVSRTGIGVQLTFTVTDGNGKPIAGATAVEKVVNKEGESVETTEGSVPLDDQGRGSDFVTYSRPDPKNRQEFEAFVAKIRSPITTTQEFTLTITLKSGIKIEVTQTRTLTNVTEGRLNAFDPATGTPGYTFSMQKLKGSEKK